MRSLVYGSIALMGTLGGVAGFYVMLDSPFVAMFQLAEIGRASCRERV